MEIKYISLISLVEAIKKQEITSEEAVKYYINNIETKKEYNAVIEVFSDAIEKAKEIDKKIKNGEKVGRLAGAPIIIKDNMLYKGKIASCASYFLKDYVAQYTSTAVQKLLDEDAIILGRANMDEFAMGGSNEKSYYGPCKNAHDLTRVSGGSSGGSACSVAADFCIAALGSDTGGSIRQPAAYNGVVGTKPTYGKVSRYGIAAFASSLDQVGPITRTVKDNALLLEILSGRDDNDDTSLHSTVPLYLNEIKNNINGLKVGLCSQIMKMFEKNEYYSKYLKIFDWFKANGAEIVNVEIPNIELSLPCYYILAPAEASSNFGKFDGIKYSTRDFSAKNVDEVYTKSRSAGFGKEVQRRIMLGNFVLSSGYYDAYYNKAKAIQQNIKRNLINAFEKCNVIILPTTSSEAFLIGEKNADPTEMYLVDLFTVPANITGNPAISVPFGKGTNNLPIGLQIFAKHNDEGTMFNVADYFENNYKEEI